MMELVRGRLFREKQGDAEEEQDLYPHPGLDAQPFFFGRGGKLAEHSEDQGNEQQPAEYLEDRGLTGRN